MFGTLIALVFLSIAFPCFIQIAKIFMRKEYVTYRGEVYELAYVKSSKRQFMIRERKGFLRTIFHVNGSELIFHQS